MLVEPAINNPCEKENWIVPFAKKTPSGVWIDIRPGTTVQAPFIGLVVCLGSVNKWNIPEINTRSGYAVLLVEEKLIFQPVSNLKPCK
jgi:hypothetical protein